MPCTARRSPPAKLCQISHICRISHSHHPWITYPAPTSTRISCGRHNVSVCNYLIINLMGKTITRHTVACLWCQVQNWICRQRSAVHLGFRTPSQWFPAGIVGNGLWIAANSTVGRSGWWNWGSTLKLIAWSLRSTRSTILPAKTDKLSFSHRISKPSLSNKPFRSELQQLNNFKRRYVFCHLSLEKSNSRVLIPLRVRFRRSSRHLVEPSIAFKPFRENSENNTINCEKWEWNSRNC